MVDAQRRQRCLRQMRAKLTSLASACSAAPSLVTVVSTLSINSSASGSGASDDSGSDDHVYRPPFPHKSQQSSSSSLSSTRPQPDQSCFLIPKLKSKLSRTYSKSHRPRQQQQPVTSLAHNNLGPTLRASHSVLGANTLIQLHDFSESSPLYKYVTSLNSHFRDSIRKTMQILEANELELQALRQPLSGEIVNNNYSSGLVRMKKAVPSLVELSAYSLAASAPLRSPNSSASSSEGDDNIMSDDEWYECIPVHMQGFVFLQHLVELCKAHIQIPNVFESLIQTCLDFNARYQAYDMLKFMWNQLATPSRHHFEWSRIQAKALNMTSQWILHIGASLSIPIVSSFAFNEFLKHPLKSQHTLYLIKCAFACIDAAGDSIEPVLEQNALIESRIRGWVTTLLECGEGKDLKMDESGGIGVGGMCECDGSRSCSVGLWHFARAHSLLNVVRRRCTRLDVLFRALDVQMRYFPNTGELLKQDNSKENEMEWEDYHRGTVVKWLDQVSELISTGELMKLAGSSHQGAETLYPVVKILGDLDELYLAKQVLKFIVNQLQVPSILPNSRTDYEGMDEINEHVSGILNVEVYSGSLDVEQLKSKLEEITHTLESNPRSSTRWRHEPFIDEWIQATPIPPQTKLAPSNVDKTPTKPMSTSQTSIKNSHILLETFGAVDSEWESDSVDGIALRRASTISWKDTIGMYSKTLKRKRRRSEGDALHLGNNRRYREFMDANDTYSSMDEDDWKDDHTFGINKSIDIFTHDWKEEEDGTTWACSTSQSALTGLCSLEDRFRNARRLSGLEIWPAKQLPITFEVDDFLM